jgi:hypothetical protein
LIFYIGWLKWYYAFICICLLVVSLFVSIRFLIDTADKKSENNSLNLKHILLVIVVSFLFISVSGVGGIGYQDPDWIKHNIIFKDLIDQPWPVVHQYEGQQIALVYNIAYYLPAALMGKIVGWVAANITLYIWTFLGLLLVMFWFLVLGRRVGITALILFLFFSGIDIIGQTLVTPIVASIRPEAAMFLHRDHIEQWAIGWQYSSNATLLFWVPHHALVGWIVMSCLLDSGRWGFKGKLDILCWGLTILWSPFITLGLVPYLIYNFLIDKRELGARLKGYLSLPNFAGSILLTLVGMYYCSKYIDLSQTFGSQIPFGFSLSFAPDLQAKIIGLMLIFVFCLVEFGIIGRLILSTRRDWSRRSRWLFLVTLSFLIVLPFFNMGH